MQWVTFLKYISVQVTKVTLMPVSITGEVGDQMYLSCTTSFCFPQANVSWFISSTDITNQSTPTTNSDSGLSRTNSTLILSLSKAHNGKQVYCAASNKPNQIVNSLTHTVTVFCKYETSSKIFNSTWKPAHTKVNCKFKNWFFWNMYDHNKIGREGMTY